MYLAQKKKKGVTYYFIRESYRKDNTFLSRDLIDLGSDPTQYIIYPGGNAFYIDPAIEDQLDRLGVTSPYFELEDIFWRFLKPEIKSALESFRNRENRSRKSRTPKATPPIIKAQVHIFDRRRLHYLKFGRMEQGYLWLLPEKLLSILRNKSRDEIEHLFIDMERSLSPSEFKAYTYVIFNLHQFFTQSFAKKRPQHLNQDDVDDYFIKKICKLNGELEFWSGMKTETSLHEYLIRYVLMYFDYDYAPRSWVEDYIRSFINSRRDYRPPASTLTLEKASIIFGEARDALRKMDREELVRLYRRRAQELHPDKGGDNEKFVELTHAYHVLLNTKKRE